MRLSRVVLAVLLGGVTLLGVALGWFGPELARGLSALLDRTPVPVHGLVRLLADVDRTWSLPVLGGAGLLGGAALAGAAVSDAPQLDVDDDHLEHRHRGREVWVGREEVDAAFRDGRDLVLLRPGGGLRARLDVADLPGGRVREALAGHRWPVREEDPFDAGFVPWAEGRPGFSGEENAVLRRRRAATGNGAEQVAARWAADEELAGCGLVARVRDGRLQVRRVQGG